jgi:hypothetical protein
LRACALPDETSGEINSRDVKLPCQLKGRASGSAAQVERLAARLAIGCRNRQLSQCFGKVWNAKISFTVMKFGIFRQELVSLVMGVVLRAGASLTT